MGAPTKLPESSLNQIRIWWFNRVIKNFPKSRYNIVLINVKVINRTVKSY